MNYREEFVDIFNINVAGCLEVTNAFLPFLKSAANKGEDGTPMVINISSLLGSSGGSNRFSTTSYQCSKAAVNMLTKCQAASAPTIKFVAMHPGWVSVHINEISHFYELLKQFENPNILFVITLLIGTDRYG